MDEAIAGEGHGHDEAVAMFQAITSADQETAEYVLMAHNWDLNKSVNFFLETGPLAASGMRAASLEGAQQGVRGAGEAESSLVDLEARSEEQEGSAPSAAAQPAAQAYNSAAWADDDEELQAALTASLRTGDGGGAHGTLEATKLQEEDEGADGDDKDFDPGPTRGRSLRSGGGFYGLPRSFLEEEEGRQPRVRRNQPRGAAAADLDMSHLGAMGLAAGVPLPGGILPCPPSPLATAIPHIGNGNGVAHPDLPAGINVEEARMLEAAMYGIPYEGPMSDFSTDAQAAAEPVSPSVLHQRQLREEQDQAYHESLQADKQKANEAAAIEESVADERRRQQQAEEDAAQQQRNYEMLIGDKAAALPEEPEANDPDAVNVMVRMPNGSRIGRRFLRSNDLSTLFDFVDVEAAPETRPGTYSLVTQFPRRVFQASTAGSLQVVGLDNKQEAVFLEKLN